MKNSDNHKGFRPDINLATGETYTSKDSLLLNLKPQKIQMTSQPRIMPNGEIHYIQKGKEPPMDVRGYKRKAPRGPDAWKFVPDFPPCRERTISLWQRSCGNVGVHIVCNRTKSCCKHEAWNPCPSLNLPKTS